MQCTHRPFPAPYLMRRMDKLQQQACCHIYSARDYSLEGSGGGDGSQFITGGTSGGKVDPLLAPPSPSAMVARCVPLGRRWGGLHSVGMVAGGGREGLHRLAAPCIALRC